MTEIDIKIADKDLVRLGDIKYGTWFYRIIEGIPDQIFIRTDATTTDEKAIYCMPIEGYHSYRIDADELVRPIGKVTIIAE